jgi:hypothetical protein
VPVVEVVDDDGVDDEAPTTVVVVEVVLVVLFTVDVVVLVLRGTVVVVVLPRVVVVTVLGSVEVDGTSFVVGYTGTGGGRTRMYVPRATRNSPSRIHVETRTRPPSPCACSPTRVISPSRQGSASS